MRARTALIGLAFAIVGCTSPPPVTAPLPPLSTAAATAAAAPTATTRPPVNPPTPSTSARPTSTAGLDAVGGELVAALANWCATLPPRSTTALPLVLIGQLANGRSARETVDALARTKCESLGAAAYGDGDSEVIAVGHYRPDGAILWVDHGFWRIATVPMDYGYLELRWDIQRKTERELFFTIWSGGSAGPVGFVAVGLNGAATTMTLHSARDASQMSAQRLDTDHVLITGRALPVRPWGIASNCCLPGGHEWLWTWTASGYTLAAERQSRDSYFAINALLGAIDAGDPNAASDVATGRVLQAATSFFGPGRLWTYKASANAYDEEQAELFRWNALPGPPPLPAAPVRYQVARYEPSGPSAVITLERVGDGWIATDIEPGTLP